MKQMSFEQWLVIAGLFFILLCYVVIRRLLKKRDKKDELYRTSEQKVRPREIKNKVVLEPIEPEEIWETETVELGKWNTYPICSYCGETVKSLFVSWNTQESEHFEAGELCVIFCPKCKKIIPVALSENSY